MGNEVPAACTRLRAALLVITTLFAASTFAATVKTDKPDYAPGEKVTIRYYRNGSQKSTDVTLGQRPDSVQAQPDQTP